MEAGEADLIDPTVGRRADDAPPVARGGRGGGAPVGERAEGVIEPELERGEGLDLCLGFWGALRCAGEEGEKDEEEERDRDGH